MYEAKRAGGNQIRHSDTPLTSSRREATKKQLDDNGNGRDPR
jgi:hypothetical protein